MVYIWLLSHCLTWMLVLLMASLCLALLDTVLESRVLSGEQDLAMVLGLDRLRLVFIVSVRLVYNIKGMTAKM